MSAVPLLSRSQQSRTWTSTSDPTVNDDAADGVVVGDYWLNTATLNEFTCVTATAGAAVWRHRPRIWKSTGDSTALTGTTNETVFATLSLPGGLPGANGLFVHQMSCEQTNDSSVKTLRLRIGAAGAGTGGTALRGVGVTSSASFFDGGAFENRNATNVQRALQSAGGGTGWGIGGSNTATAAIDTTAAFEIVMTGQLADTNDSMTLKAWNVRLFRPDIGP